MRYIDAWKMDGCTYTIYQDNNRFCIFRKEKEGNVNQLKPVFKNAEDAKAWVNNELIPAWQKWHDCNKLAGQVYLDDPDELNEAKNMNEKMKKQTIKINESQLRNIIKESIKKVLNERKPAEGEYHMFDNLEKLPQGWTIVKQDGVTYIKDNFGRLWKQTWNNDNRDDDMSAPWWGEHNADI